MRALIFANGDPTSRETAHHWMLPGSIVIAADGGTRNALEAGLTPDTVIGDLDSLPEALRADLEARGVRFIVHPARKDETDLELAIRHALDHGATDIVILSALGGRWDQSLANILLLTLPALRDVPTQIVDHRQTITLVTGGREARIDGHIGDTLSLLALSGDARGVTIEGCEYPLTDGALPFGKTLGISNVLAEPAARVGVKEGIVLAIHARKT
ncbi:MAG TPA: thiamine diphosphokinase [Anaerolineae bacterium]